MMAYNVASKGSTKRPPASSKREFMELICDVPTEQFVRMVSKSGMPSDEARKLCEQFKEMKG